MNDLRLTTVQTSLAWLDIDANLRHLAERLDEAGETDLAVLPEMFSTGFAIDTDRLPADVGQRSARWLTDQAARREHAVAGSTAIRTEAGWTNRFILAHPDGRTDHYDKRHLFSYAGEHEHFTAGERPVIAEVNGWFIDLQVCYDLRFPIWCRHGGAAHLQLFVANWPARRMPAWDALLPARAIENMCYVAGVNRTGQDAVTHYAGHSAVYDPLGAVLEPPTEDAVAVRTTVLRFERLRTLRERFPFLDDRDDNPVRP